MNFFTSYLDKIFAFLSERFCFVRFQFQPLKTATESSPVRERGEYVKQKIRAIEDSDRNLMCGFSVARFTGLNYYCDCNPALTHGATFCHLLRRLIELIFSDDKIEKTFAREQHRITGVIKSARRVRDF